MIALPDIEEARASSPVPVEKRKALVAAGEALRERLLAMAPVPFYRGFDLTTLPYPVRYGLRDAFAWPLPYLMLTNRMTVVQYRPFAQDGSVDTATVRTLLVGPSDTKAARQTPYFKRLADGMGFLQPVVEPILAHETWTVETALHACGLVPGDVDELTFDHLHTQDVRRWLGTDRGPGAFFTRAKLLVMAAEWHACQGLAAPQRDWYCPDGTLGVPADRVVQLDGSVLLGEGVALVATPGHTVGNHSIAVRTPDGVLVTSENGISADCFAPRRSRLAGFGSYARTTGMDVVLNGNTLEGGLDQYLSMNFERALAGPSRVDGFPNCVPSSELTATWWAPGLTPSVQWGELRYGEVVRP